MKYLYALLLVIIILPCNSQEIINLNVDSGLFNRIDCPVSIEMLPSDFNMDIQDMQLLEVSNSLKKQVQSQFDKETNRLWFILNGFTPKETIRAFTLIHKSKESIEHEQIVIRKENGSLQLRFKNSPILNYQFEMVYPPKGIDEKYKKSGFLHPVWSPGGEVLTRIQPPDHYHHYGIWGPWTRTLIGNRKVDFWNLAEGQGTVLFKDFLKETQGDVFSGFTTLQEHIDFGASTENRVAINEELEVRVWNLGDAKTSWLVDYTTKIYSPLETGIVFEAYRYGGGIGFRATEKWYKDNTSVLTSENRDRLKADGSSAKWAIVEGESDTKEGRSGILFMGFPTNHQFPEPMRVWPINSNEGRGDMFFEFCPIRHVEWKIESQKEYGLKYRILIFDGTITAEQAEMYWQGFANPPKISIESI